MAQMSYTAANIRPLSDTLRENRIAGEALTVGTLVTLDSNGYVVKTDANDGNLYKAFGIVVESYDGETSIASGKSCTIVKLGSVAGFESLTEGTYGYVSETAGQIADAAPTGNAYQLCVGYALNSDTFFFMPGMSTGTSV